jgi:hypothetical protein
VKTRTSAPALAALALGAACQGVDLQESDEDALFLDARVRKDFGDETRLRPHAELDWSSVRGDSGTLDYAIDAAMLGAGVDFALGGQAWLGVAAGLEWQLLDFETSAGELHDDDDQGLYAALEGRWLPTAWLEPYALLDSAFFSDATRSRIEAGMRLHVIEHAALFAGWRSVEYDIDEVTSGLVFNSIELELSGLVVGLQLSL